MPRSARREALDWAASVESQTNHIAASGFAPVPKDATLGDLIDVYGEKCAKAAGRSKAATHAMLKRELGGVKLSGLNALVLRDFIDRRIDAGAGGVTIAADLSFLSAILKWARRARHWDIHERLAIEARESLAHRGLETRSNERAREPTDDELERLYNSSAYTPIGGPIRASESTCRGCATSRWRPACARARCVACRSKTSTP